MDKNYKPVYVRGTETGIGVIKALEQLGGINRYSMTGRHSDYLYFIDPKNKTIDYIGINTPIGRYIMSTAKEIKPARWRAEKGSPYYIINWAVGVKELYDDREPSDDKLYNCGNYFRTRGEAQEMAEKIKKVLLPD